MDMDAEGGHQHRQDGHADAGMAQGPDQDVVDLPHVPHR
jgi:hypothetical protein